MGLAKKVAVGFEKTDKRSFKHCFSRSMIRIVQGLVSNAMELNVTELKEMLIYPTKNIYKRDVLLIKSCSLSEERNLNIQDVIFFVIFNFYFHF